MVVEAENLTSDLSSSSTIYARIIHVLQSADMHIIEKEEFSMSGTLTIVMREGKRGFVLFHVFLFKLRSYAHKTPQDIWWLVCCQE